MNGKKKGLKLTLILLTLCLFVGLLPTRNVLATNDSPYSRINVQADEAGVFELAQAQYSAKNKSVDLVYNETSTSGDIVVNTDGAKDTYGDEGYGITVSNGIVTVTAATNAGAVYGLQNVLQQLEKGDDVSEISATQPYKETRALFVDTARKYFGVSWFEEIIREMAWNGLNTLYISFSNDEGFRFLLDDMSLSFDDGSGNTVTYSDEFMSHVVDNPEKVADSEFLTERNANATDEGSSRVVSNYDNNKYYTEDDMERILAYAKAYGINVIPEFNSPGHFGQVMWYFPEYRIQGTWYEDGQPHYGLDLTNTEAYNFGTALVKKYIDFFAEQGCTAFCVGGDEYSAGNATNAQIAAYTNGLVEYVESKDMQAYAWNDGQAAANGLLKDSAIVNCWNGTSSYDLINFDSSYLYYVLKSYNWKPNAQTLYESWNPNTYNNGTDLSATMKGASLAIWCDVPNKETPSEVLKGILPDIQAFGYKMWNYSEVATTSLSTEYDSYSDFSSSVTNAPKISEATVLSTVDYDISSLPSISVDDLSEPSVGSGYELVTFDDNATIEDGTYIIVNGTNQAMTNTVSGTGLGKTTVTISDSIATPLNDDYEWTFTKQSDGTYYITNSDGEYININSSGVTTSTTPQSITATFANGKVQLSNGNYAINYYASSDLIFSWWYTGTSDSNNLQTLYKKFETGLNTLELYNAIVKAAEYSNTDGKYGSEEYATLQTVLSESISLYVDASDEDTTITQDEVDAQTEALLAAINALELSDTTINYIEIPVEILDFRADGVMFEYAQNTDGKGLYELLTDEKFGNLTYAKETVSMPGELGDRKTHDEWNGWDTDTKRTGLVESYLVNGAPVYKEATVDYVAKLIAKGYFKDYSGSITNWNSNISSKITSLYNDGYDSDTDTNSNLGSWDDTLTKTSTSANGGNMTWSSVETCYDLAYYVLNNMWRSTQSSDGVNTYNKTVGERTTLRMLLDDEGYYRLDSSKEINYVDNYIYNTDFETTNTAETKFTPINDLGYEASDVYGDTTDITSGTNFHYTLHANGSFVYNADDNLYFYFDGDDDVYFYINGQLVMDLGGAHSHCDDELYLNDIADELGLEDGGIYTFDMFYAERHTTQANLEFSTNIKIMDTMSTTSKGQYNASTGASIPYGAIVDEGTEVAYSFELLNMRSVNVTDITFVDETLGSYLSKNTITLYDAKLTNGAATNISDIIVYYHTYDRPAANETGTLNSDSVQIKTVAQIKEMINKANSNGYSSLDTGSYMVKISSEDDLKTLLELGVPIDTQICVYGVKRIVTDNDRPYINTVTSHAYYTSNGKKIALNGVASQKLTVLNSFSSEADKEQIVIDYGKAIRVSLDEVKDNLHLNDGVTATFYGITTNGTHNQIRTSSSGINGTNLDTPYSPATSNGTYYLRGQNNNVSSIEFKLNKMISNIEKVYAVYEITDTSLKDTDYKTYYVLVEVDIIPATSVYYETDFADGVFTFTTPESADYKNWSKVTVSNDTELQTDTVQDQGTVGNNQTYGYDSTYTDDKYLSDGSSYYVEGQGRTKTISTFSFTGTGFDLISRTGEKQGAIRVDIYSDAAMTTRVKAITVINKSESNLELYQIPVVSVNNLDYGTYYVKIGVNAAYTDENKALSRGNQFYFDAIRIYDPINQSATSDDATIAKTAYASDGELAPEITEVREIMLDSETYNSSSTNSSSTTDKTLFVDKTQSGVDLGTYTAIGPNNEVYLNPGNAIAFKVSTSGVIGGIDIGAKSADGNPVVLSTTIANASSDATASYTMTQTINSSTALFYDVLTGDTSGKNINDYLNSNGEAYIIITNTGNEGSILSITDIKVGYNDVPATVSFLVDDDVLTFANYVLSDEPDYDIQSAELTASTYKIYNKLEMKVVTTTDVESLVVKNKYGMKLSTQTSYVINDEGMKVWTVKFRSLLLGNQTFSVTGYGSDGSSGSSATVNAKIKLF